MCLRQIGHKSTSFKYTLPYNSAFILVIELMQEFASGLKNPLLLRSPNDDSGRMFVVEQQGTVQIFYVNGTRRQQPFFDLSDTVLGPAGTADERGFLGLAFHPKFSDNSRFFAYFRCVA